MTLLVVDELFETAVRLVGSSLVARFAACWAFTVPREQGRFESRGFRKFFLLSILLLNQGQHDFFLFFLLELLLFLNKFVQVVLGQDAGLVG